MDETKTTKGETMKIEVGDRVVYKSADAFGSLAEKHGVVEKIKDGKVYLGRRRWVKVKNIVRIASQSNGE